MLGIKVIQILRSIHFVQCTTARASYEAYPIRRIRNQSPTKKISFAYRHSAQDPAAGYFSLKG